MSLEGLTAVNACLTAYEVLALSIALSINVIISGSISILYFEEGLISTLPLAPLVYVGAVEAFVANLAPVNVPASLIEPPSNLDINAAVVVDTPVNLIPTAFLAFCNLACLFKFPPTKLAGVAVKDGIVTSSLVVIVKVFLSNDIVAIAAFV